MPGFRIRSKQFFLTYPRCDRGPLELKEFIFSLNLAVICDYIIAREQHEDEGLHLHAWIKYDSTVHSTDCRVFDFHGFHPNIQSARSPNAIRRYLAKDGDFISATPIVIRPTWGELLSLPSRQLFLDGIIQHYPRDYALNHDRVQSFARIYFNSNAESGSAGPSFTNLPPHLVAWASCNLPAQGPYPARCKSLWLYGPTRTGKTTWSTHLPGAGYMPTMFNADAISLGEYCGPVPTTSLRILVLDDFDYDNWQFFKQFVACQPFVTFTDKYRPKLTVKWGIPTIFVANDPPPGSWPMQYCEANMDIIYISESLF